MPVARSQIQFLEPWYDFLPGQGEVFLEELKRELSSGHLLESLELVPPLGIPPHSRGDFSTLSPASSWYVAFSVNGGPFRVTPKFRFKTAIRRPLASTLCEHQNLNVMQTHSATFVDIPAVRGGCHREIWFRR